MKTKNIYYLILLFIILSIFYYFTQTYSKENLEAVISGNAFTDLRCLDDSLPIYRFINKSKDTQTFQCLSKDKINCMVRSDFNVDKNVKCQDINTYLVKEIRNANSPVRQVYNDLQNNTNYNLLSCTPDSMNKPGHWCNNMFNNLTSKTNSKCYDSTGNKTNDFKYGYLSTPCKNIPAFANSTKVNKDVEIIDREAIIAANAASRAAVSLSRVRK